MKTKIQKQQQRRIDTMEGWTQAMPPRAGAPFVAVDAGPGVRWGVLRRQLGDGIRNDLTDFTFNKLHPVAAARVGGAADPWSPTATYEVMLPQGAPSDLLEARRLVERYEAESFPGIKDLAIVCNFRIDKTDEILTAWSRVRAFARKAFCEDRSMAVIAALHVPARSGVRRDAHVHLVAPARELGSGGYGAFLRPFCSDAGAAIIRAEWAAWE
ncbi:hypothetical protein NZL82_01655 [Sphingomonas sanguinis]|uniref:hypothetical protein n=1 Tax=Sphingomonas sp. LC-1 TaxID=3110957 RepID=UPI0021BB7AB7|nr:hypothetical protein [Sphingomonas sp. LC-1]MCT8000577.1 hypothetical protein [Sphingomonas sp. LC-1]